MRYFRLRLQPSLSNDDLLTVISAIGKELKILMVDLNDAADDDHVIQQITLLCPVLETLLLSSGNSLTDFSLTAITNNCKHVTQLVLHGECLTDHGVSSLLRKIGDRLTSFGLVRCSALTSASLVSIMTLCNNLEELELSANAGIPIEELQVRLLCSTENYLPQLKELEVEFDEFDGLMDFVTNPDNGVDQKWTKVLGKSYK